MFWNKKKLAKFTAQNKKSLNEAVDYFQEMIAETETISDPAQRLLALLEIEETINKTKQINIDSIDGQKRSISGRSKSIGLSIMCLSLLPMIAVANLLSPVIWVAFAAYLAGAAISVPSMLDPNKETKGLEANKKSFIGKLDTIKETVQQKSEALMQEHMPELFASKNIKTLTQKVPALREAFIDAAIARNVFAQAPQPQTALSVQP